MSGQIKTCSSLWQEHWCTVWYFFKRSTEWICFWGNIKPNWVTVCKLYSPVIFKSVKVMKATKKKKENQKWPSWMMLYSQMPRVNLNLFHWRTSSIIKAEIWLVSEDHAYSININVLFFKDGIMIISKTTFVWNICKNILDYGLLYEK